MGEFSTLTRDLIRGWFRKARHDEGLARLALSSTPLYSDGVCFHAQQAVEKLLKALLVHRGVAFQKTHHLTYLLDLISNDTPVDNRIYELAERLQSYAVEIRYPDAGPDPSPEEAADALDGVEAIRSFVLRCAPALEPLYAEACD